MYDVLIIGSGAGGGALALRLSQAGARVLVLEKGPHLKRQDFPVDEVENYRPGFWYPSIADEPHMVVTPGQEPKRSSLGWIATCVGGGTVHMGAYLYRFHPEDFRLRSRFGSYASVADWPYSYEEIEPYYVQAEWELGVSGSPEPARFGFPRSRNHPMPPLDDHPISSLFDHACAQMGLDPFPTPRAINSEPYQGRPSCSYCRLCSGFGCRTGAKGSSQEALIPRAQATGNCELIAKAMVLEVTVGKDGRATGCRYLDAEGREQEARARIVCVCCSSVESARLLLMSRSPLFPDGLGNGNGQVGKNLQFHAVTTGMGRFRVQDRDPLWRDPHPFMGRSLLDHYFLPPGVSPFPKGGIIRYSLSQLQPVMAAQGVAMGGGPSLWGNALKQALREHFLNTVNIQFEVFHDYIPNPETHVGLDPSVTDKWGLPVARICHQADPHHRAAGAWLQSRGLEVLEAMGADELVRGFLGETAAFLVHGSCRAGDDPSTSVLNGYCQSHEVPNLFVVDGSFMPTCGGAPPTLTIVANSFRAADHILERGRQAH